VNRDPTKFWNPYLAGVALGFVLLGALVVTGKGLGASGASFRIGVTAVEAVAPGHVAAAPGLRGVTEAGSPLDPGNLRRRVLKPLAGEVGAPWAGFHTFRHTFASLHLSQGTNLLQLSRALGHHSPAFTLTRYTHLLPGDETPVLKLGTTW